MIKKLLISFSLAILPILASAQDWDVTIDGIFYYLDDYSAYGGDTYATVHKADNGLTGTVFIPETVTGASGMVYPVKKIDEDAFAQCQQMTAVVIPDNVTSIGEYAFGECTALKAVYIGKGLTFIDEDAFEDCSALRDFTVTALTPPSIDDKYVIQPEHRPLITLHVPTAALESYKADEFWGSFKAIDDKVSAPSAITVISLRPAIDAAAYNLQGRRLQTLGKGIVIKKENGVSRKVVAK